MKNTGRERQETAAFAPGLVISLSGCAINQKGVFDYEWRSTIFAWVGVRNEQKSQWNVIGYGAIFNWVIVATANNLMAEYLETPPCLPGMITLARSGAL